VSWPVVALGDLVDIRGGGTPSKQKPEYWGGAVPWASVKDFRGAELNETTDYITTLGVEKSATNIIPAGNIIVPTRMALGKVAINTVDMAINQDLKALIVRNEKVLDKNYLKRFLEAKADFIEGHGKGATVKGITLDVLRKLEVPVPPIREQKRIATILDKADAIRRKRQQAIQLADEFLRSVFLDMFGDPVINPKGWEVKPLKQLARVTTGSTPSRKEERFYGDHIEWIKSDNINTPCHFLTKASESLSVEGKKVARVVGSGSILVTCIAGSFDCIGNVAYADREVAFNQQINALTPFNGVRSWFLYALIIFSKKHIQSASTNSMKGMVSKGKMEEIPMICPPLSIQDEFQEVFLKFLSLTDRLDRSFAGATDVFDSLSQQAFSGEI